MKLFYTILADLIRRGQVRVDISGVDMDKLEEILRGNFQQTLLEVAGTVFSEEMTDGEKVAWLKERLGEG